MRGERRSIPCRATRWERCSGIVQVPGRSLPLFAAIVLLIGAGLGIAFGAEQDPLALERRFADDVLPFLRTHCLDCHGAEKQEGKLNLSSDLTVAAVVKNFRVWEIIVERLATEEMPPQASLKQPTAEARRSVLEWAKTLRDYEAERNAGDPGTVLARRLSNAEFDNTIRDLTGVDIRPTREFPVDPANEAGFDNSGESLSMSPALVKKYFAAARHVADHVVLTPKGFVFAPHPAVTETDRDKFCVQQIVAFYQRHDVDYADYFLASWRFQNREVLGKPDASLSDFATEPRPFHRKMRGEAQAGQVTVANSSPDVSRLEGTLSPKYLATVWSALTEPETIGPLAELQAEWQRISNDQTLAKPVAHEDLARDASEEQQRQDNVRRECETLRDLVVKLRKGFDVKIEKLHLKGNSDGSQPLVLWWNRQIAAQRMKYSGDGTDEALDAGRTRFCRVFPNAFSVSSRGHYADSNLGVGVRLLTAGFHLMQGYFRDDEPLCELVLDESGKIELDSLWQNLNFVTLVPIRQYKDFLFFERAETPRFAGGPEFDFARPEDKDVISETKLKRMCDAYVANARQYDDGDRAIEAIKTYFANMSADFRWIEKTRLAAEPSHLESLLNFAERAYRRPLSSAERDDVVAFYQRLREHDGLGHEDAIRDSVASILMSPHFCFRFDLAAPGEAVKSLSDYELASRLSYFLWSSMPDDELLAHAEQGDLHEPEVLMSQARRMLHDRRVRGLATEFSGNWLDFRRFEEHNSVDRERFASFTNELRQAMYEEPLRLFTEIVSHNGSVLEFLDADHTFVNPILAKHYGIDLGAAAASIEPVASDDGWFRIDNAHGYGRGGLPAMSVFLTKNSPGLRTSPVKRGYWVVRRLLGERIPAPPPSVPELPKDEASLGELTLPQLLAQHRNHKACAGCHQRFDSIGLVFEGYGPIGERRDTDLGGRPVDAGVTFPDGAEGTGIDGLRRYLIDRRGNEFVDHLSRMLFSYSLGRSLILSDKSTIDQMRAKLVADEYRFESLIRSIITSPQFLKKRGMD